MPNQVVNGAILQCTMGIAPGTLTVLPTIMVTGDNQPEATIMDFKPMVNIGTFGMCQSPANPQVAAATAAAMGVLTPMPCIPATVSPWTPGSTILTIQNLPALLDNCQCACMWAGVITITQAGQVLVSVDS